MLLDKARYVAVVAVAVVYPYVFLVFIPTTLYVTYCTLIMRSEWLSDREGKVEMVREF